MKEISVLVAVYNVEKYIEKCLESAFSNTYANKAEFIIVNDCTLDSSMKIAEKTAERFPSITVKFINHEKNRGLAAARNTGMENASCPYICFLDSDDYVEKDWLETLYKGITEDPENDVFLANYYNVFDGQDYVAEKVSEDFKKKPFQNILSDVVKNFLWRGIFKRIIIVENNIHWFENYNFQEDFIFNIQYYRYVKKADFCTKPVYHYIIRKDDEAHQTNPILNKQNLIKVFSFVEKYLLENGIYTEENILAMNIRKLCFKIYNVINGSHSEQKLFLYSWPESKAALNYFNLNRISRFILSHSEKKSLFVDFLAFINSIFLRKIKHVGLKPYFD